MTGTRTWKLRATAFAMAGNLACIWFPMMFELFDLEFGGPRCCGSPYGPLLFLLGPSGWLAWAFWGIGRNYASREREVLVWGTSLLLLGLLSLLWIAGLNDGGWRGTGTLTQEIAQAFASKEAIPSWQLFELMSRAWFYYGIPSGLCLAAYGFWNERSDRLLFAAAQVPVPNPART